jgi:hypothetical protein
MWASGCNLGCPRYPERVVKTFFWLDTGESDFKTPGSKIQSNAFLPSVNVWQPWTGLRSNTKKSILSEAKCILNTKTNKFITSVNRKAENVSILF